MSRVPHRLRSFSLRTLMVLVGVAALVCWLVNEWRFVKARAAFVEGRSARVFAVSGQHLQGPDALLRDWLGDWRVEWIEFYNPDTDARTIQRTASLFPEAKVTAADTVLEP